jgi:hypothetical protein
MSTRMSSESEYSAGSGRCQSKRFLNLWVWARESQLPINAAFIEVLIEEMFGSDLAVPRSIVRWAIARWPLPATGHSASEIRAGCGATR